MQLDLIIIHLAVSGKGRESDGNSTSFHHGPEVMISWSVWSLRCSTKYANQSSHNPGLRFQGIASESDRDGQCML